MLVSALRVCELCALLCRERTDSNTNESGRLSGYEHSSSTRVREPNESLGLFSRRSAVLGYANGLTITRPSGSIVPIR